MSEMIERVARALFDGAPAGRAPAKAWDELRPDWQDAFRVAARLAIEAMREPSFMMVAAMQEAVLGEDNVAGNPVRILKRGIATGHFFEAWRAAIDAELKLAASDEALRR